MTNFLWTAPTLVVLVAAVSGLSRLLAAQPRDWYLPTASPTWSSCLKLSTAAATLFGVVGAALGWSRSGVVDAFATLAFFVVGLELVQALITDVNFRKLDSRLLNPTALLVVVTSAVAGAVVHSGTVMLSLVVDAVVVLFCGFSHAIGSADTKLLVLLWSAGVILVGVSPTALVLAVGVGAAAVWAAVSNRRSGETSNRTRVPLAVIVLVCYAVMVPIVQLVCQNFGKLPIN